MADNKPSDKLEEKPPVVSKAVEKSPDDPVKLKCSGIQVGPGDTAPKELKLFWENVPYVIPVGGIMKGSISRRGAEFLIAKSRRYWSLKADLQIVEPNFG
jgi:hypothetical protein